MKNLLMIFVLISLAPVATWASPQSGQVDSPGVYTNDIKLPNPEVTSSGVKDDATVEATVVQETTPSYTFANTDGEMSGYDALNMCADNFEGRQANDCIDLVKDSKLNTRAVQLCLNNNNSDKDAMLYCLSNIANNTFTDGTVDVCSEQTGMVLSDCFSIVASVVPKNENYKICKRNIVPLERNACLMKLISPKDRQVTTFEILIDGNWHKFVINHFGKTTAQKINHIYNSCLLRLRGQIGIETSAALFKYSDDQFGDFHRIDEGLMYTPAVVCSVIKSNLIDSPGKYGIE